MLKRTITYENWDGVKCTEDFYFNLTKAELIYMEAAEEGGLQARLDRIIRAHNGNDIVNFMRYLIRKSYGIKSPDGRKFMKSEQISDDFESTAAYDKFIEDLVLSEHADQFLLEFMNGIIPKIDVPEGIRKRYEQLASGGASDVASDNTRT